MKKPKPLKKEAENKLEKARDLLKESGKLHKKACKREEVVNRKERKTEWKALLQFLKKRPKIL